MILQLLQHLYIYIYRFNRSLVEMTSTPRPSTFFMTGSPLPMRSATVTAFISRITSNILSFGISSDTLTGSTDASAKTVLTVEHIVRLGSVISLTANSCPPGQLFPVTKSSPSLSSTVRRQPRGQPLPVSGTTVPYRHRSRSRHIP